MFKISEYSFTYNPTYVLKLPIRSKILSISKLDDLIFVRVLVDDETPEIGMEFKFIKPNTEFENALAYQFVGVLNNVLVSTGEELYVFKKQVTIN